MPGPLPGEIPKPPLGLKPRWLAEEQRAMEVSAAIARYVMAGVDVPKEWEEELQFLHNRAVARQREGMEKEGSSLEASRIRAIYGASRVVCVDDCGGCGLTKGQEYEIVKVSTGMVRVVNDQGQEKDFFMERFRGV